MRSDTVALRRRLVDAVRQIEARTGPPSTRDICDELGVPRYGEIGYRVYPNLRSLERLDVVKRAGYRGELPYREVCWVYTGELTDAKANELIVATEVANA